jgi:hypothetical protein
MHNSVCRFSARRRRRGHGIEGRLKRRRDTKWRERKRGKVVAAADYKRKD